MRPDLHGLLIRYRARRARNRLPRCPACNALVDTPGACSTECADFLNLWNAHAG